MKKIKRLSALLLTLVVTIFTFSSTTAFAAETIDYSNDEVQSAAVVILADEDFSISTSRSAAGNIFQTSTGSFMFDVDFTPAAGRIVAVRLHDVTTHSIVQEWQSSNGSICYVVHLSAGHRYQFEYLLASGSGNVTVSNFVSEM